MAKKRKKSGRKSVRLKNFTGTVSKRGGQVVIRGRGKR